MTPILKFAKNVGLYDGVLKFINLFWQLRQMADFDGKLAKILLNAPGIDSQRTKTNGGNK